MLAKHIARSFSSALIIDPLEEFGDLPDTHRRYHPKQLHASAASDKELDLVIGKWVMNGPRVRRVDLWLIDEANRFFPNRRPMPRRAAWLNDTIRHAGLAWGCVARRPVQLHTDLLELAHYLYIFRLTGVNDLKRCDDLHAGLADMVVKLPPHHFIERDAYGTITVHEPVPFPG